MKTNSILNYQNTPRIILLTLALSCAGLLVGCGDQGPASRSPVIDLTGGSMIPSEQAPQRWSPIADSSAFIESKGRLNALPSQAARPAVLRTSRPIVIDDPIGSVGQFGTALRCVTSQTGVGSMSEPRVARIMVTPGLNSTYTMHVSRGPQLRRYDESGGVAGITTLDPMAAEILDVGGERLISGHIDLPHGLGQRDLSLDLTTDGDFFYGTYTDRIGDLREAHQVTCWEEPYDLIPDDFITAPLRARDAVFNRDTGRCQNGDGQETYNQVPIEYVRETGDGMCADLRGHRLNGDDFGYPVLRGWSLEGALLDGAQLSFAQLKHCRLAGAQMRHMVLGYAKVEGQISGATVLPEDAHCEVEVGSGVDHVTCIL